MHKEMHVLFVCAHEGFPNLLRIPRILKEAGCTVTLLTTQEHILANSRFNDFVLPKEPDVKSLIVSLKNHLTENPGRYAWILIGDESPLFEIIKYRGESWIDGWFPVDTKSEALDIIAYKDGFVRACMSHGIPFPATQVCDDIDHALVVAENIGYPVMLKTTRGSSGYGVRSAKNSEELLAVHTSVGSPKKFILQKLVTGQVGITEMLLDRGEPLAWISSYKYQTLYGKFGPSCARQFMVHPDMEGIIQQIGKMTHFHGLCGFDWIHHKEEDAIYVIEFHARPSSGFYFGEVCHVNFAEGIRNMLSGKKTVQRPVVSLPASKPKIAYMFPQHISRCIKERDILDFIHWIPGIKTNCHYDILLNDSMLLKGIIKHCILNKLTGGITVVSKKLRLVKK
jgi:predicted ATP-grasp superfamily ATP-dependent carboligase